MNSIKACFKHYAPRRKYIHLLTKRWRRGKEARESPGGGAGSAGVKMLFELLRLAWIVLRVDIGDSPRPVGGQLQHGLAFRRFIMGGAGSKCEETPRRQRLG